MLARFVVIFAYCGAPLEFRIDNLGYLYQKQGFFSNFGADYCKKMRITFKEGIFELE